MDSQQEQDARPDVNEFLAELFRIHGIESVSRDGWIVFPAQNLRTCGAIVREAQGPSLVSVQLDVRFEIGPGRTIIESVMGYGQTREQAVADAQRSFMVNSFHVLLAAFFTVDDPRVTREEWVIGGRTKRVTIGSMGVRGTLTADGALTLAWFERFQEVLKMRSFTEGTHWVRLYYGQQQHRALACQVLLDDDVWEEMQAEMAAVDWPSGESFYGVRVFLVLQGGLGVSEAITTICRFPDSDDEAMLREFMACGAARLQAEKLVTLIPLALGRTFLEWESLPLRLPATATIRDSGTGALRPIRLDEEPIYTEALRLAATGALRPEHYLAVASRSPEVSAVYQTLQAGSRPEHLLLSPPMLSWSEAGSDSLT